MKKKVICSLLVGAAMAVSLVGSLSAVDPKIVFKLSEIHAKGYPTELADEEFAKLVSQYTNGEIRVDVYPGGELSGDEKVIIEQVKVGAVHMARVSTGSLGAFNKQMEAFGLPYLFDSSEHLWAFLNGSYGQKMLTDLMPSGFFGLTRQLYADQPDWVAKIQAADPAQMQAIGALPVNQQLAAVAKIAGLPEWAAMRGLPTAKSATCLADANTPTQLVQMQTDAVAKYPDFPGTPTFILNGKMVETKAGSSVWSQLEESIKTALGS